MKFLAEGSICFLDLAIRGTLVNVQEFVEVVGTES